MQNTKPESGWAIDLPSGMPWRYIPSLEKLIITAPHQEVGEFWIAEFLQTIAEGLPLGIREIQFQADDWNKVFMITRISPGL